MEAKIKALPYFSDKTVTEIKQEQLSTFVKFKKPGDEINSQLTFLHPNGSGSDYAYSLFIKLGAIARISYEDNTIKFMISPEKEDDDNIEHEFPFDTFNKDVFNTMSRTNDLVYEDIIALQDIKDILNQQ